MMKSMATIFLVLLAVVAADYAKPNFKKYGYGGRWNNYPLYMSGRGYYNRFYGNLGRGYYNRFYGDYDGYNSGYYDDIDGYYNGFHGNDGGYYGGLSSGYGYGTGSLYSSYFGRPGFFSTQYYDRLWYPGVYNRQWGNLRSYRPSRGLFPSVKKIKKFY